MMDTSEAPGPSVMPCLPPGGLFEIVFSFDTTGSMSSVADEVKGRLQDMIQRLQADIPGIRMGLIAHGDYCDKDVFYLEKHIDFSNNIVELCDFLNGVEGTGGGDPEECYEYVLRMTSQFSWTPGSQRALVVIGDATPHEPDYELNVDNLDWRKEAESLDDMGIKIYAVQAFDNADSTAFFQELVEKTGGHHVKLGEFSHICDFIMAICYREKGEDFLMDYEAEVRAREGRKKLANDLEGLFGVLRRGDSSVSNKSALSTSASNASSVSVKIALAKRSTIDAIFDVDIDDVIVKRKRVRPISPMSRTNSLSALPSCSAAKRPRMAKTKSTLLKSVSNASSVSANSADIRQRIAERLKPAARARQPLSWMSLDSSDNEDDDVISPMACTVVPNAAKAKKHMTVTKVKGHVWDKYPNMKLRHTVPDTKFILRQNGLAKRWSPWKLAITTDIPKSSRNWVKRDKGHKKNGIKPACARWRRRALFPRDSGKTRVLYEVATQRKRGGKMRVMFCKWGQIGANPDNWEQRILGKKSIRQYVDGVLGLDYKVYVRRFVLRGMGKNQRENLKMFRRQYKYAWSVGC